MPNVQHPTSNAQRPTEDGNGISAVDWRGLKKRSERRRKKIVGHYARNFADAEQWDLEFWQKQTPQMRLSALVAIRNDILAVRGKDKNFDWDY